jgi:hypothetical protein
MHAHCTALHKQCYSICFLLCTTIAHGTNITLNTCTICTASRLHRYSYCCTCRHSHRNVLLYVCILCYLCYRSSDPLKAKGYADAAIHSVNVALAAHYPNCKYLHQRQHMHVCMYVYICTHLEYSTVNLMIVFDDSTVKG